MDPGRQLLQHLKTVPNLVNEDPSTTTPKNTSFMDVPWSQFNEMMAEKRRQEPSKAQHTPSSNADYQLTNPEKGSVEDFSLGNWDASTGYQDSEHPKKA